MVLGSNAATRSHTFIFLPNKSKKIQDKITFEGNTFDLTRYTLHLYSKSHSPVVGTADDVLAVEPDAAHELLVALEYAQAGAALDVPESNRIVAAAAYDQPIAILKAGDATLVSAERAHELARRCVPNFDRAVAARRHNVLLVEVDDVHRRPVAHEDASQRNLRLRRHVPDGD